METLVICFCISILVIINLYAFIAFDATDRKIKNEAPKNITGNSHEQNEVDGPVNKQKPYYERYIKWNKNPNDFLDFSGGMMGI